MKAIIRFVKSEKFGHGLGVFLILGFFYLVCLVIELIERTSLHN